jgi:protein NrfC
MGKDSNQKFPPPPGYIEVDPGKCAGCQICMLICSLVHEGKCDVQLARIQIIQDAYKPWPDCIQIKQCRQCPSPACIKACPAGAAFVDTEHGNVRVIDESKCTGCQACLKACPFNEAGMIWNVEKQVAGKCDLCANASFLGEPGGPDFKQACVAVCPHKALTFKSRSLKKE